MMNIKPDARIFFDGYCPESLLKGDRVPMRLNADDFWESEATGLQISVFPPYATVLRWRGKGQFRETESLASNTLYGLILAQAQKVNGREIFPDENEIIVSAFDLEYYLSGVCKTKEVYDASKFDPNALEIQQQRAYLDKIAQRDIDAVIRLFNDFRNSGYEDMTAFIEGLYEVKLIFSFNWMDWHQGEDNLCNPNFDFTKCSLLDLSMYLTTIARADRFNEGLFMRNVKNGVLDKIINSLRSTSRK